MRHRTVNGVKKINLRFAFICIAALCKYSLKNLLTKWQTGLTVRPELVEGWTVKPFMVRQAHHERLKFSS
jgi:hypothetical protein